MPVTATEDPVLVARPSLSPPLKWAGGKRWQLPVLEPLWAPHRHRRLVEPFCGGLAVPLGLRPDEALLNDLNPHVVNFYRWLQHGLRVDVPLENTEGSYYSNRERFNALLEAGDDDAAEAAALFYYLNRTGYNGLCRFNRRNRFNVPFGRYARIRYTTEFGAYRDALAGWTFTCGEFDALHLRADDFVYADPPYDVEFRQYAARGFSWDDQVRTAEFLAAHPGPVVLANQATTRILDLYRSTGYDLRLLDAPRRISCDGNRAPVKEVLATRNV